MYAFLVILGAVISAAGIALVASGVSIQERAFDLTTITPGAVAVIGGLILIGLGLAVRVLQRIERVLAVRPMRALQLDAAAPVTSPVLPSQPAALTNPGAPKIEPKLPSAPVAAVAGPAAEVAPEPVREKFPTLVRLEGAPVVAASEVALSAQSPSQSGEQSEEVANARASGAASGSAPLRTVPRPETSPRPVAMPNQRKSSVFESLWPKGPRVGVQAQARVVPIPAAAPEPEPRVEPRLDTAPSASLQPVAVPVSILKSGVVDGMAYTLYSDGSIEAQLPQGTLRFGSITDLRNHIEHGA
jgi:hypothetical protein